MLRQAQDIFEQRPDLGVLPQQAAELRAKLTTITAGPGGASSLTTAELRLLPLLSTHLTLKEISERLYVSRNTVKTQAASDLPEVRSLLARRSGRPHARTGPPLPRVAQNPRRPSLPSSTVLNRRPTGVAGQTGRRSRRHRPRSLADNGERFRIEAIESLSMSSLYRVRRRSRRCMPAADTGDSGRPNGSMNSAQGPVALGTLPSRSFML